MQHFLMNEALCIIFLSKNSQLRLSNCQLHMPKSDSCQTPATFRLKNGRSIQSVYMKMVNLA